MNKIQVLFHILKKVNFILSKNDRHKLPFMLICQFLAAVLETLGIAIVIPFMNSLLSPNLLFEKWYAKLIADVLGFSNFYSLILFFGIAILIVYMAKNVVLLLVRQYANVFQCNVQASIAGELMNNTLHRNYSFFFNCDTSDLLTGIFKDSDSVYQIIMAFVYIFAEVITAMAIGVFIFFTDWKMSLGIIGIACVIVVIIVFGFKNVNSRAGFQYRESYNAMYTNALQSIGAIKEVKKGKKENFFYDKFVVSRQNFAKSQIRANFINLCPERIVETVFVCGIILLLVFRIRWGADVTQSIANLSAFALAGYRLMPSINKISTGLNNIVFYEPSLEAAYIHIRNSREERKNQLQKISAGESESESVSEVRFDDCISIKDLVFSYSSDKIILNGINLKINKGKAVAFIGETGSGKSTLIDIILGLLTPQKGSVCVDGLDIQTIPNSWAKLVGYVPQSIYLLDASIRENIAFGIEISEIDNDRVEECIRIAQLEKFVSELPEGLDTVVGEQGVRLSGGQRQRIAIARAMYNDPEIIVLDEATSALDNETEKAVMEAINALHGKKTLIIVAHRLSTITECDEIYEVKNGGVTQKNIADVVNK